MNITQIRERVNKISKSLDPTNRIAVIYHPIIQPGSMKVSTVLKSVIGERRFVQISEKQMIEECRNG